MAGGGGRREGGGGGEWGWGWGDVRTMLHSTHTRDTALQPPVPSCPREVPRIWHSDASWAGSSAARARTILGSVGAGEEREGEDNLREHCERWKGGVGRR